MTYLSKFCITILTVAGLAFGHAQAQMKIGFSLPPYEDRVTVPFKLINNLVVIPVTINNQITLNFILDTGANTPILTERLFGDILKLDYDRSIQISGPGIKDSVSAHVANRVRFNLPHGIKGSNLSLLVLEQDYIELKKNLGEDIYGILGYDIFKRFVVEINYDDMDITFHNPEKFRPSRRYESFDLTIENSKPFVLTEISHAEKSDSLKLMIDTGASHALLVDLTTSENVPKPDTSVSTSLGHGLGGEIPGRVGRYQQMSIGKNRLSDILVSIPDEGAYSNAIKRGSRHGTIGGHTLSRFNVIFDYGNRKLYLRRNSSYTDTFEFDMSGLRISFFENPNRLEITGIMENSPADHADLEIGDVIESLNGRSIKNTKLSTLYSILRSKDGKRIRIKLVRDEESKDVDFRLKRMI